ncbi:MAG: PhyR family response regulator anti-anti-sigma factor [Janthinobacterium lividum]
MTSPGREDLIRALPYARRYARALIGSQVRGDALVAASLRAMLDGAGVPGPDPRLALYASITRAAAEGHVSGDGVAAGEAGLSTLQRQLLLLTALEGLSLDKAAAVAGLDEPDAAASLAEARLHLREAAATDVLIIEDEPIIAMDLEELVAGCGHRVVGVACSEAEAVEIALRTRPGLILADVNLGHGGDGASAVATISRQHQAPVIFVTAYPERLLTGEAVEPAFVITKPFEPLTLAIATYQAVTGGVRLG